MKKKSRRPSPFKRFMGILGYTALLGVACGAGVVANMASRSEFFKNVVTNPLALLNADPGKIFGKEDGLTLLILGTDDDRKMIGWGV
ncbi:hypothetical protein EON82_05545, partial [bacterium]